MRKPLLLIALLAAIGPFPQSSSAQSADFSAVAAMLGRGLGAARSDYAGIRTGEVSQYGFYALSPAFTAICERCRPLLSKYGDGGWSFSFKTYAAIAKSDVLAFITRNFSAAIPSDFKFAGPAPGDKIDDELYGKPSSVTYEWRGPATNVLSISADESRDRPGLLRIDIRIRSNPTGARRP